MNGKLQKLYREFRNGEYRFSKTHVAATQTARLNMLRSLEAELPEEEIPPHDRLRFEVEHCGAPISTFEHLRNEYAVLEIDDRYSPKLRLYGVASGKTGVMKLKKALFNQQPFAPGSILRLLSWERKPSYRFVDGKARPNGTATDLWITGYEILT